MNRKEYKKYLLELEESGKLWKIYKKASKVHDEVNQFYGPYPYSYHLWEVGKIVKHWGYYVCTNPSHIITILFGAYFHDSIEDARLTYNDVKKIAKELEIPNPELAADIVYALTNEKGKNRQERESNKYFEGIQKIPYAPFIKLADRAANIWYSKSTSSRMFNVYLEEWSSFIHGLTTSREEPEYSLPNELIYLVEKILKHG